MDIDIMAIRIKMDLINLSRCINWIRIFKDDLDLDVIFYCKIRWKIYVY